MKRAYLALVLACGASESHVAAPSSPPRVAASAQRTPTNITTAAVPVLNARTGMLSVAEARAYMVELINRDRKSLGLPPVTLDAGSATVSGQKHAEDMAHLGYLGHWGSDGSVPEQRLTEAGGADMVMENALCMTDLKERVLDPSPHIAASTVEEAESMFWNETPPHDGHRKNIATPSHNQVGIGVAMPKATPTELPTACFSQEFLDHYGSYNTLPAQVKVGSSLHIEATLTAPARPGGIGFTRTDAPKPLSAAELNTRRSYPVPNPYQNYWPKGFDTPIPITVDGQSLRADLPISDGGKPGLYEVSIWAKMPGHEDFTRVSLRTIVVTK